MISATFCSQEGFTGTQCNGDDGGRGLRQYHHQQHHHQQQQQQKQHQQPSNHFKGEDGCVPASKNLFNIPLNSLEFGEKNLLLPLSKPQDGDPGSTEAERRSRELSGTETRSSLVLNPLNFSDSPFTSSPWMKGSAPDQSADSLSFSHRGSLENQHRADKRLYHAQNQVPGFALWSLKCGTIPLLDFLLYIFSSCVHCPTGVSFDLHKMKQNIIRPYFVRTTMASTNTRSSALTC